MILLWFIFGIILITIIARYNESNKLFWMLLFSYIMGFAGAKMVAQAVNDKKQSNVNLTQVYPTQVPTDAGAYTLFQLVSGMAAVKVTDSKLVSQDYTPALSEKNIILSEILRRTRDQPLNVITGPPKTIIAKGFFNTS